MPPDAPFVVLVIVTLGLPWLIVPPPARKPWAIAALLLGVAVIIGEGVAIRSTGQTLSQLFWSFSEARPTGAIAVLAALAIGGAVIIVHLARRLIRRRRGGGE